jgi:hypothetical protein
MLAEALGVNESTVYKWARQGVIRRGPDGAWNLEDVKRQRCEYEQREVRALANYLRDGSDEEGNVLELRPNQLASLRYAEFLRARTQNEEVRLAKLRGDLVDRRAINEAVCEVLTLVRSQLLGLGDWVAPMLIGVSDVDEIRQIVRSQCERILSGLSAAEILERADEGRPRK